MNIVLLHLMLVREPQLGDLDVRGYEILRRYAHAAFPTYRTPRPPEFPTVVGQLRGLERRF